MSFWPEPEYTVEPILRTYRIGSTASQLWEPFRWQLADGTDVTDRVINSWRYIGPAVPR
jgi:hypothetical protein